MHVMCVLQSYIIYVYLVTSPFHFDYYKLAFKSKMKVNKKLQYMDVGYNRLDDNRDSKRCMVSRSKIQITISIVAFSLFFRFVIAQRAIRICHAACVLYT